MNFVWMKPKPMLSHREILWEFDNEVFKSRGKELKASLGLDKYQTENDLDTKGEKTR